ncbi:response regulator [Chondromyces crocatus]|nr:response regulator [Chondromyces crocatus]
MPQKNSPLSGDLEPESGLKSGPVSSTGSRSGVDSGREPTSTRSKKKILVVDDSFTSLSTQQGTLADYDVVLARNGREGIRQAITERPDLILMDVNMPGMDGFQACRWLRAFEATKTVPIIIMTTRSDPQSVKVAYANGCNGYLVKPFKEEELLTSVRKLLGES